MASIKNDIAKILDKRIDILAKEAQIDNKSKRTAKAVRVFKISIRTSIHHEIFREFGLSKMSIFASLSKGFG